jgi:uncharacterized protein YciI
MVNKIQILRSGTFGNRPAVGAQPYGVPYVNFGGLQLGVVDSTGTPRDLIGVTFFTTTANYTQGQPVNYQGQLYIANTSIPAGPWNPAQWTPITTAFTSFLPLTGGTLTGALTVNSTISASSNIYGAAFIAGTAATVGTYYFGTSAAHYLTFDGTNFNFSAANITVTGTITTSGSVFINGSVVSSNSATTGAYQFGNSGNKYLQYDGTSFNLVGGNFNVSGGIYVPNITVSGNVGSYGVIVRPGTAGPNGGNAYNINWTGTAQLWIDATNMGTISLTSDYRIKKDVVDLPDMWDTVKKLRPIKYTQAEFSPPAHLDHITKMQAEGTQVAEGPLFPADDIERWGFLAHEIQQTTVKSAATGEKDSPDTIQSPNPWTIIAALTKALQEAMARIEALEAK